MSCRALGVVATLLFSLVTAGTSVAQTKDQASGVARFTGTWKEDVSKRKIGSFQNLVFRRKAKGELEELRGSELRPMVQTVNFTGKPYSIDAASKNTIAWKQIDSNSFERAIYNNGRLLNTRRIRLSADGKTLTEATELVTVTGKGTNTIIYRRVAGDRGLIGRWQAESFKIELAPQLVIEMTGANALKITSTNLDSTVALALDNKPVPVVGATVIPGSMVAARQTNASTIEFTNSRDGIETGKTVREISADGKTMTVTSTELGPNAGKEPFVQVYVKQ
jgi:hypothetical protein